MNDDSRIALQNFKASVSNISSVENVRTSVDGALESGIQPIQIVNALSDALEDVGKRYEAGEYFLSELIMAGVLAPEVTGRLEPHLKGTELKTVGTVVIGTVKGDIHDLGKNIVIMMLRSARFRVIDLGVDVPAERFVDARAAVNFITDVFSRIEAFYCYVFQKIGPIIL